MSNEFTSDTQRLDIVEHSAEAFVAEVVAKTLDGWAVSATNPGDAVGFGGTLTVSMYRNSETLQTIRAKMANIQEKPKMSPAESLAKAREARNNKTAVATQSAPRLDVDTVQ